MNDDKILREELLSALKGGGAHMTFQDAVAGFPLKEINRRLPNASYTVWHLLEHVRLAQGDILGFVRNPRHVSPDFPDGYWPKPDEKATTAAWRTTIKGIETDLAAAEELVSDPETDFFSPLPHAKKYNVFREILLIIDHNAYHVAELVTLRRVLGLKPIKEY